MKKLTICSFGRYSENYARQKCIIEGFRDLGVNIIELKDRSNPLIRYFKLSFNYIFKTPRHDYIFVNLSRGSALLAIILGKLFNRKVIFDAFISFYDVNVFDLKLAKEGSLKARFWRMLDKIPSKLSDVVVLDTRQYANYFVEEFGLNKKKFHVVHTGANDDFSVPLNKKNRGYILSYSSYLPVHGLKYVAESAKILEKHGIQFLLIGNGVDYPKVLDFVKKSKIKNVSFVEWVKHEDLRKYIAESDICLGLFGESDQARRVIGAKVFECVAMGKPVVNGRCEAIEDFFKDNESIKLCDMANSESLAKSILELKENPKLKNKIAEGGNRVYSENFSRKKISLECKKIIDFLIEEKNRA